MHVLVCAFIAIGHSRPSYDVIDSWIYRLGLYDETMPYAIVGEEMPNKGENTNFNIYATAWYYVTTSITTIGYGDIVGVTTAEKLYIIFLLFAGILIFTII